MTPVWDGGAWCNALWLLLCLVTIYVAVYWSACRAFRVSWHHLNAEAMAQAVEETAESDTLTEQLGAVDGEVSELQERVRRLRDGGEGDTCGRGR